MSREVPIKFVRNFMVNLCSLSARTWRSVSVLDVRTSQQLESMLVWLMESSFHTYFIIQEQLNTDLGKHIVG